MPNKIIDVSSNNGSIDWNKVKSDGVTDVIIRLSLGFGDKDVLAPTYAKQAKTAGVNVSYYHLAYPDTKGGSFETDAKQEANYFTGLFLDGSMPIPKWLAVDLEKMRNGWDTPLNKTEYLKWLQIFLGQVYANTGITCLLYSNQPYLDLHLPTNHGLGSIPLWIANYNSVPSPRLPLGWDHYFLWQYSEKGKVLGINGNVDLNVLRPTVFLDSLMKKQSIKKMNLSALNRLKEKKVSKPLFADRLSLTEVYGKIEKNNNSPFSKELIASICWAESSFKPDSVASGSTSKGLMMMNKGAVQTVNSNTPSGVHFEPDDMFNPDLAIACGTWYLKILFTKPDFGCQGDKRKTLKKYRGGSDFIYADKIIEAESCLQSTVVLNPQTCLNQIHP